MIIFPILFLIASYFCGYILINRFLPENNGLLKITSSYLVGILVSFTIVLLSSLILFMFIENALTIGFIVSTAVLIAFCIYFRKYLCLPIDLKSYHIITFSLLLLFSWFLFSSTVGYESKENILRVSRFIWSDYGFHVPLIRSFSLGNNLNFEHPLYAHESLHYHFMFDFMVGAFERFNMPLDYAITIPSSLLWTSLLILIYYLGKTIFFGSIFVGAISSLLFLFNSSLSFLEFFKKHGSDSIKKTAESFWNLREYVAFGPWDGNIIGAFWNWNIYINQRHFILGIAVIVALLIPILKDKLDQKSKSLDDVSYIFIGAICGLLPLWHSHAYVCMVGFLGLIFILFPNRKPILKSLIAAIIVSTPQIIWLQYPSENIQSHFSFNPGYMMPSYLISYEFLSHKAVNNIIIWITSFFKYWFFNVGISLITIFLSLFFVDRKRGKLFLIFLSVFILGNLFQFSAEMGANHKFFNLWLVLSNTFTAYLLSRIYKINIVSKIAAFIIILLLIISGIIDSMPVKNDFKKSFEDYKKNPIAKWVVFNTNPQDVFLTSYKIYNPISFTGRKSIQGWPYFAWSAGFDTNKRNDLAKDIYAVNSVEKLCKLLKENKIDYILLVQRYERDGDFRINHSFYEQNFEPEYIKPGSLEPEYIKRSRKPGSREKIYKTQNMCD